MPSLSCIEDYRDEIKLKLTGDLLESELDDDTLDKLIKSALRELNRYITDTTLITIPYKKCIDLSNPEETGGVELNVSTVVGVYRATGMGNSASSSSSSYDPMEVAKWQMLSGMGNLVNFQDAIYNYAAWTTLQQIQNTTSTDMAFIYDNHTNKLYINVSNGVPENITLEFIPVYTDVEEIKSDYWADILVRLSMALCKVTYGRIRTRYTQTNALWTQDGETLLEEGKAELSELREMLSHCTELMYPID